MCFKQPSEQVFAFVPHILGSVQMAQVLLIMGVGGSAVEVCRQSLQTLGHQVVSVRLSSLTANPRQGSGNGSA